MSKKPGVFSTLTSVIISDGAQILIDSYVKALGANVMGVMNCPQTQKIIHAGLKLGESTLFISDAFPEMDMPSTGRQQFYLYVDNADEGFKKAKSAGFHPIGKPEDMFWGDRVATLKDPNGNTWKLAHKVRDVSPEEMQSAIQSMAQGG